MSFTNISALFRAEFVGPSSAGNFTVTGVKAGDVILTMFDASNSNYQVSLGEFRSVAPADNTLYAGGGSLDGHNLVAIILRD